ncbi:MAG: DUF2304 domain-containing protein [Gemmatimonadetes bacterium]|nr:DUF2304 domain-containing protein [Gemmatimonadota bacterium]
MTTSQLVLLGLIGLFIVYVVRMRSASADRLMYLGLAALGIGLVLNPELTNRAAAALGIGRGADLMFYFFIVFCLFHFATTAAALRRLQRDLGELTRVLALQRAEAPPDQRPATPPRGG